MSSDSNTRDPRLDPRAGDVLMNRGVRREAQRVSESGESVRSFFLSPRWRHTEWAPITTWRKWAKNAEVLYRAE